MLQKPSLIFFGTVSTTIPDETDHENDDDDADCDIVMKMKQAGAKNFFS